MYTTKDIKSITVQSVYLIIIRMNDNKSYVIGANELVDIINKELYLKKYISRVSARVDDDLKARLDGYESEIRDRMSKSKGKSESNSELRSKFSAGELDTIDKIVDEIEKFKEIIGGKCDQGSDLGAAEAAHIPPPQATQLPTQVVSPTLSPLESKVSDFISNSFSSNSPNSPNPTDNLIDKVTIINSTIDTPIDTPINTSTISDCINTINTDVNTINTGNNSSNSYYCKIDNNICNSRCNSDNPSISDTTHIKTVNSSSNSDRSTNSTNRFKRFIKTIKSIFKTTRYN
jgi:hypothetical protein